MGKRRISAVAHNNLLFRSRLWHILEDTLGFYYVKNALTLTVLVILVLHPAILFAFLMHFNVIGDIIRNVVFISVFLADCAFGFIGGVVVEYKRTQQGGYNILQREFSNKIRFTKVK